MDTAIDEFGYVTVADLFDAIGETGNGFTDQKRGWDAQTFEQADVKSVRGGYILDLPAPRQINA
jgi:hypothetical protein